MIKHLGLVLILVSSVCAQDTLTVSPRVGKIIDAYEREYFGIFPQAGPFAEAVLVHQSGSTGNINVFIETETGISRIADTITRAEYYQLGKYIDEYEPLIYRIQSRVGTLYLDQKYGVLLHRYLLRRPRPVMDAYYTVSFFENGRRASVHGSLLYCDGMYVVLDPDPKRNAFTDAVVIPSRLIEEISTSNIPLYLAAFIIPAFAVGTLVGLVVHSSGVAPGGNSESARLGVITGMVAGIFGLTVAWLTDRSQRSAYQNNDHWKYVVLPELQEKQFFRRGLPPELRERLYPHE